MREIRGVAAYGLVRLASAELRYQEAHRYGEIARRSLSADNPLTAELLSALVRIWIELGERGKAVTELRATRSGASTANSRMRTLGLLARLEANTATRYSLAGSWAEAWHLATEHPGGAERDQTLADLALAAAAAGSRERMDAAIRALPLGSPVLHELVARIASLGLPTRVCK